MNARNATVAGLLAGAAGIVVLLLAGAPGPIVPPSLVILLAAAAAVAFLRYRWAPLVGVLAALTEIAGVFASGSGAGLVALGDPGILAGSWIRMLGVAVAVIAGAAAVTAPRRERAAR